MDNSNKTGNSGYLIQGSILAIASIISRIIGLFYRLPMTNIIGDMGNNYFSAAFDIYNMVLIITSCSIPAAVSKMVSARLNRGQKKRAYGILKGALLFALLAGLAGGLFLYFLGGFLSGYLLQTPLAVFAVRILAPVLLLTSLLGVFRGFFEGMGDLVPGAISSVLEQIVNAIISIWAAYALFRYGRKVGAVLGDKETFASAYGAAGGMLGIGAGTVCCLLFMLIMLVVFTGKFKQEMAKDQTRRKDSVSYVMRVLGKTMMPLMFAAFAFNFCGIFNHGIFKNIAILQGYSEEKVSIWWGVFSGKYQLLVNIPLAIATAAAAAVMPMIGTARSTKNSEEVKKLTGVSLQYVLGTTIPFAVGFAVLAVPVFSLLFPTTGDTVLIAARLMWIGSVSIVFFSAAILSNSLLQGMGKLKLPVRNALIALGAQTILLIVLMLFLRLNIYAVVISEAFFAFLVSILNLSAVITISGWKVDPVKIFVKPLLASAIMGVSSYIVYFGLNLVCGNSIAAIAAVLCALLIYPCALLTLKWASAEELEAFPLGEFWSGLAKKVHAI